MRTFILAAGVVFATSSLQVQAQSTPGTALSSPAGRFVLGQISSMRRDQFMVDTQTGRLWTIVCTKTGPAGDCTSQALQPVMYVDSAGENFSLAPPPPAQGR